MQAIELPKEFQIITKKRPESQCGHGYLFRNLKEGRAIKFKHHAKNSCGIYICSANDARTKLGVSLFREGPNLLNMVLFNFISFSVIKRTQIHVPKSTVNSRIVLKMCPGKQRIIFYHESQGTIEIRSLLSLKVIKTYSLSDICQSVQMTDLFAELRTSVDLEYISHLSSIIMLLGSKIVLIADKKYKEPPLVVFNAKEVDRFRSMHYDPTKRMLMAVAISSLLLVEFDNFGVSCMRLLTSDKLGRSSRFLCWNPKEDLVVFSQKVNFKLENYYIMSYKPANLTVAATIRNIPPYGHSYDESTQTLFFVEDGMMRKRVSSICLKDFNTNFKSLDEPIDLEGQYLTCIPDDGSEANVFKIFYCREALIVKPMPNFDHYSR